MAHIKYISVHMSDHPSETMTVTVLMKPPGEATIKVPLPRDFFDCLMKISQLAADEHEQQMRAQILADTMTPPTKQEMKGEE